MDTTNHCHDVAKKRKSITLYGLIQKHPCSVVQTVGLETTHTLHKNEP